MWGRALLEAARRPKSDWKYNLGVVGRVTTWGGNTRKGRNVVSRKSSLAWVNMSAYTFFVSGPKFTKFFPFNRGGFVVDQVHFRFSVCGTVPETFVIKVESCEKSPQILDVFALPNFVGAAPQKSYPRYHACSGRSHGKVSWSYSH